MVTKDTTCPVFRCLIQDCRCPGTSRPSYLAKLKLPHRTLSCLQAWYPYQAFFFLNISYTFDKRTQKDKTMTQGIGDIMKDQPLCAPPKGTHTSIRDTQDRAVRPVRAALAFVDGLVVSLQLEHSKDCNCRWTPPCPASKSILGGI